MPAVLRQPGDCRQCHAEIFSLKKQRHAEYWMAQAFPVLLVIRNSRTKSAGWKCATG